ncbi:MAG: VWA domain-containing protein, partial [Candidatus Lokiarchaeota archaeon]
MDILQLLFLAALILALARPFTWTVGASSQALILILDTSASMAAGDATPNRLEVAKAEARQLVDGLPDDARVTVITAGDGAQVLVASSQDRRLVQHAIDGIYVGTGGGDLTAALELASAIAARQPDTEIAILSDGRATLPERLAVKGRVRYLPLGQSGDNQAIARETSRQLGLRADIVRADEVFDHDGAQRSSPSLDERIEKAGGFAQV